MKGKTNFTELEAEKIIALIEEKLKLDSNGQKGIRAKIRNLGFYASDFGLRDNYTVADFKSVTTIAGKSETLNSEITIKAQIPIITKSAKLTRSTSDESYIIDLCDEVLKQAAQRQHRFDFLKGDTGVRLPVDAYYAKLKLVVEYHERQHTEEVKFFDKRITSSGVGRGEQRKLYDERRKTEIPQNDLSLIILNFSEFVHSPSKRLHRDNVSDIAVIEQKLKNYIK